MVSFLCRMDVRIYIECFICSKIFSFTRSIGPIGVEFLDAVDSMSSRASTSDSIDSSARHSNMNGHPSFVAGRSVTSSFAKQSFQLRLASLRFLTLEHMGLTRPDFPGHNHHSNRDSFHETNPVSVGSYHSPMSHMSDFMLECDGMWRNSTSQEYEEEWRIAARELCRYGTCQYYDQIISEKRKKLMVKYEILLGYLNSYLVIICYITLLDMISSG